MTPHPLSRSSGFLECSTDAEGHIKFPELHCPYGHKIPWEFAFHEAGYPRCQERDTAGRSTCNARLFIQFFPRLNTAANPMLFVAEVTYADIQHVTKHAMDVPAILAYLGVTWAPPRAA